MLLNIYTRFHLRFALGLKPKSEQRFCALPIESQETGEVEFDRPRTVPIRIAIQWFDHIGGILIQWSLIQWNAIGVHNHGFFKKIPGGQTFPRS